MKNNPQETINDLNEHQNVARHNKLRSRTKSFSVEERLNKSAVYNPFSYIFNDDDVLKLTAILIDNFPLNFPDEKPTINNAITPNNKTSARRALLNALTFYLYKETNPADHNFLSIVKLLNCANFNQDETGCENLKTALEIIFDDLEHKDPEHIAVLQYNTFKFYTDNDLVIMREVVENTKDNMRHLGWWQAPRVLKPDVIDITL